MDVRLVAIDIDGTLIDSRGRIPGGQHHRGDGGARRRRARGARHRAQLSVRAGGGRGAARYRHADRVERRHRADPRRTHRGAPPAGARDRPAGARAHARVPPHQRAAVRSRGRRARRRGEHGLGPPAPARLLGGASPLDRPVLAARGGADRGSDSGDVQRRRGDDAGHPRVAGGTGPDGGVPDRIRAARLRPGRCHRHDRQQGLRAGRARGRARHRPGAGDGDRRQPQRRRDAGVRGRAGDHGQRRRRRWAAAAGTRPPPTTTPASRRRSGVSR